MDLSDPDLYTGLGEDEKNSRKRMLEMLLVMGADEEQIRDAIAGERLAVLPVELTLASKAKYNQQELAEKAGLDIDFLEDIWRASGLTFPDKDEKAFTDTDLRASQATKAFYDAGLLKEGMIENSFVVGQTMSTLASAFRRLAAESYIEAGVSEQELAARFIEGIKFLLPKVLPMLEQQLERHMLELIRHDMVTEAERAEGSIMGQDMAVAFADLVGFTRLGERVEIDELGGIVMRLAALAREHTSLPVQLVKTMGDGVMLVSTCADTLLDQVIDLVELISAGDHDLPALRAGVAYGPAIGRHGDWYGATVNVASRVTEIARPGSVLVIDSARMVADKDRFHWSRAGERKLKGVKREQRLFRVRHADASPSDSD